MYQTLSVADLISLDLQSELNKLKGWTHPCYSFTSIRIWLYKITTLPYGIFLVKAAILFSESVYREYHKKH